LIANQTFPIILSQPETDCINPHSLTFQPMTFNSQPTTRAPQNSKPVYPKASRANKPVSNRTGNQPASDPKITQPRPDKKPKTYDLFSNPTQNPTGPIPCQEILNDIEAQGEKKRRREEDTDDSPEKSKEAEHFLTAGPGSQACRDQ
jgi:hypothetical protein